MDKIDDGPAKEPLVIAAVPAPNIPEPVVPHLVPEPVVDPIVAADRMVVPELVQTQTVFVKAEEEKPRSNKGTIIAVAVGIVVVLVIIGAAVFTVLRLAGDQKKIFADIAAKQVQNLDKLSQNTAQILTAYKDKENSDTSGDTNATVLGLEDTASVIKQRELSDMFANGKKIVADIETANKDFLEKDKGWIIMFLPKKDPTEGTDKMTKTWGQIYDYFIATSDREIRSSGIGFNFGLALQMAIDNPDDTAVARLTGTVNELKTLMKEEKNTNVTQLPDSLVKLHNKVVKNDEDMVNQLAALPGLFKNKDIPGIVDNVKTFYAQSMMVATGNQLDMVSFWQGDEAIKSIETVRRSWQDYGIAIK